eukprot:TRINITY_DN13826_c0_g1_i3.p1 TRINITY_DN13826_c0_g1~~TRINITY_DN13826_c0_g1_i3.p1  ORF type:complete len:298 (-),score=85.72 TRINITY_DN13826_c0_g1_i3:291-1184(-)
MEVREYLVQSPSSQLGFELVSGTDILQGQHRGQDYRSIRADLGPAQKSVFETLLNVEASGIQRLQERRSKLAEMVPSFKEGHRQQRAALKAKFDRLREVVRVLEEAVLEKSEVCYEEDLLVVTQELQKCTDLEAEMANNMAMARAFIWDEGYKNSKAPAAVAHADLSLMEITQIPFDAVETRDTTELINLKTIEDTAVHLEQCAVQSGLKVPPQPVNQAAEVSAAFGLSMDGMSADVFERLHRDARKKQLEAHKMPTSTNNKSKRIPSFPSVEPKLGYFESHTGGHTDLNRSPGRKH